MPLLLPALKRLSLGGNSLRDLPDDLGGGEKVEEESGGGPGLEWLWLENNAFRRLPPQLVLVAGSLRHLSLALNPLAGELGPRDVLASLRNLETLDLSECALEGVPEEIGELTCVRFFEAVELLNLLSCFFPLFFPIPSSLILILSLSPLVPSPPPPPPPLSNRQQQPPHPPRPPLQPHLVVTGESPGKTEETRPPFAALERARGGLPGRGPPRVHGARVALAQLEQAEVAPGGESQRLHQAVEALSSSEQARPFAPPRPRVSVAPRGALPLWQRDFRIAERAFFQGEAHQTDSAPPLGQRAERAAERLGDRRRDGGLAGAVAVAERPREARVLRRRRRQRRRRREEERKKEKTRAPFADEAVDRRQRQAERRGGRRRGREGVPGAAGGARGLRSVRRQRRRQRRRRERRRRPGRRRPGRRGRRGRGRRRRRLHPEEGGRVEVHRRCLCCCCCPCCCCPCSFCCCCPCPFCCCCSFCCCCCPCSCCPGVRKKNEKNRK